MTLARYSYTSSHCCLYPISVACFSVSPGWVTYFPVSYVEANSIGYSSRLKKLRSIWRMESVLRMVEMPSRLAIREDNVLLPVPDVPPSRIVIDRRLDTRSQELRKSSG